MEEQAVYYINNKYQGYTTMSHYYVADYLQWAQNVFHSHSVGFQSTKPLKSNIQV